MSLTAALMPSLDTSIDFDSISHRFGRFLPIISVDGHHSSSIDFFGQFTRLFSSKTLNVSYVLLEALGPMVVFDVSFDFIASYEGAADCAGVVDPQLLSFGVSQVVLLLLSFGVGLFADITDDFNSFGLNFVAVCLNKLFSQ